MQIQILIIIKARCHAQGVPPLVRDTLPPCLLRGPREDIKAHGETDTDANANTNTDLDTDTDTANDSDTDTNILTPVADTDRYRC